MARGRSRSNGEGNGATLGFEAKLWQAADALRNNMDAAEYKHVVLGLIFLKYISDAFEAKHAELDAQRGEGADPEDPDEYRAENIFWVPPEARWSYLKGAAPQPTIGQIVDDAMAAIERDNPSLKSVLPKDYARPGLDKQRLGQLINLVSDIGLGSPADRARDILGRVYEYFLSQFASAEGKKGGQFYTPTHVVRVLVEIARVLGGLDDKIELNRRMNETLEAMARALFKWWFVDFDPVRAKAEGRDPGLSKPIADLFPTRLVDSELDDTPEGWPVAALPDVIDVNPTRSLRKGQLAPYLDMANMPTRGHTPDIVIDRPFGSGMRFVNGDTLIARITPCLENGKTAFVDFLQRGQVGWGSTEYIVLRPRPPLPGEFAYCLARSDGFREFAVQSMTGTSGRQRVQAGALSHYLVAAPPKKIGEYFGTEV
jgi:hypothetical protein